MLCLTHRGDGSPCPLTNATFLLVCHQLKLDFLEEPQVSKCQQLLTIHRALFSPPKTAGVTVASLLRADGLVLERQECGRGQRAAFPRAASDRANEATTDVAEEETLESPPQKSSESRLSKSPPGPGKLLQDGALTPQGNPTAAKFRTMSVIWEICSKHQNLITVVIKRQTS